MWQQQRFSFNASGGGSGGRGQDGIQNGSTTLEDDSAALHKTKPMLTMDSNNRASVYSKVCTQMFPAALVTVVKTWKQP
jgi:hypothetical protein